MKALTSIGFVVAAACMYPSAAAGQFLFEDATSSADIFMRSTDPTQAGAGVIVFDLDGDGWDDIYMAGGLDSDKLYHNLQNGLFEEITPSNMAIHVDYRTYPRGGIAFDYDNDGKPDLYLVCQNRDILWHNNGNGSFTDVTRKAELNYPLDQNESMTATFGDFNGDGLNDFYVARWIHIYDWPYVGWPNWFYVNNGNGTFTDRAKEYGIDGDTGITNIALFFDYDRDGDLDLLIGNDYGNIMPNQVWKNMLMETGEAKFVNVTKELGLQLSLSCMGIGPCDFNRDGQFDFVETSIGPNRVMEKSATDTFVRVDRTVLPSTDGFERSGSGLSTTSWTALMADYDNDGWEDGFIVHGYLISARAGINPTHHDTSIFLHNNGHGFDDYTDFALGGKYLERKGRGAAYLDYNHDGKLDICLGTIANDNFSQQSDFHLLKNITQTASDSSHWLELRFTARRTAKEAIGTIVDVWSAGVVHSRQVSTGGGFGSQNSLMQHIGLGTSSVADSINVFWPADKNRHRQIDHYYHVSADRCYHIRENVSDRPDSSLLEGVSHSVPSVNPILYPNPARRLLNIENLQASELQHIEVFNQLGIKQISITNSESSLSLALSSLKPGCYILRIITAGHSITRRFIKE